MSKKEKLAGVENPSANMYERAAGAEFYSGALIVELSPKALHGSPTTIVMIFSGHAEVTTSLGDGR